MKTVIYHSADFDGIFCREIAKKFLGTEGVNYIGWNHGDPLIPFPHEGTVYVLDLSPDCLEGRNCERAKIDWERVVWIDHHKSSIEKWSKEIPGYRIAGVAACRLAWQWFRVPETEHRELGLPEKRDFVERRVSEPLAVRLAGEYDIWDKRDPNADVFQYGLRSKELTDEDWKWLLTVHDNMKQGEYELAKTGLAVNMLLQDGRLLQRYSQKIDADLVNSRSFMLEWEGLKFLCLNTGRFNSLTFAAKDAPETGHDALLGWCFDGKNNTVSLYHAKHRTDLDLSLIAVKYGGGGHRGACGFTCKTLPFLQ